MSENILRGSLTSTQTSKGALGFKGERGYSNYEIYVKNGGTMTEQEWLDHFGVDLTGYAKTSEVIEYVGDLEELETEDKTDIVSAINENQGNIEALDEKTTPKYCVATITTAPTISSNYYVPLDTTPINEGYFTLQDGGIRIHSGINRIRVSGSVFIDNWPAGIAYLWVKIIRKRGAQEISISGSINGSPSAYMSSSVPTRIIDVQEGDIIKLMADSGAGGNIRAGAENTWLCVEKIS